MKKLSKLSFVMMLLFIGVALFVVGCTQSNSQGQVPATGAVETPPSTPSSTTQPPAATPRVVKLEAYNCGFNPSTITVKKGETIKLEIFSTSGTHSIAIQGYPVNSDTVSPGRDASVTFTADKVGTFEFFCSIYCGAGQTEMIGKLVVTE